MALALSSTDEASEFCSEPESSLSDDSNEAHLHTHRISSASRRGRGGCRARCGRGQRRTKRGSSGNVSRGGSSRHVSSRTRTVRGCGRNISQSQHVLAGPWKREESTALNYLFDGANAGPSTPVDGSM